MAMSHSPAPRSPVRSGRAGLSRPVLVDAAIEILDERGVAGLTLAALADRLGVAAPSLYKHVTNLAELRTLVGARVIEDMTGTFGTTVMGRSGDEALAALMHGWRAYALEHPARYAAVPPDPLGAGPPLPAAAQQLLDVVVATMRGYRLDDATTVHAVRTVRAAVHGFVTLETAGGFGLPEDVDETFERLVRTLLLGLRENGPSDGATPTRPRREVLT